MNRYEKVYIACPSTEVSGGAESIHQLSYELQQLNIDVFIYVIGNENTMIQSPKLDKYKANYVYEIIDNENCCLIVPEPYTFILKSYQHVHKIIWWLSLDNYLKKIPKYRTNIVMKKNSFPFFMYPLLYSVFYFKLHKFKNNINVKNEDLNKYFHFYNAEYIRDYLLKFGVDEKKTLYLCGPIDDIYFDKNIIFERENIVLYNPKKGYKFTQYLIHNYSFKKNIRFVAIQNMTPFEICNLMSRSKVYIDFGEFPGPERIPREAVVRGCCIITSLNGAARNNVDVPIKKCYKFNTNVKNIEKIGNLIEDMIYKYDEYANEYDLYKDKVLKQRTIFKKNILKYFKEVNNGNNKE